MTYGAYDGARISSLRRRLGITQEELARRIGTTVCAVDRWEHGFSQPEEAERALLAEVS